MRKYSRFVKIAKIFSYLVVALLLGAALFYVFIFSNDTVNISEAEGKKDRQNIMIINQAKIFSIIGNKEIKINATRAIEHAGYKKLLDPKIIIGNNGKEIRVKAVEARSKVLEDVIEFEGKVRIDFNSAALQTEKAEFNFKKHILKTDILAHIQSKNYNLSSLDGCKFRLKENVIEFFGPVEFITKDAKIHSNYLQMLTLKKIATFVGNVKIITPNELIESERAIYNDSSKLIEMIGGVVITKDNKKTYAKKVVYSLNDHNAKIISDEKTRVKINF